VQRVPKEMQRLKRQKKRLRSLKVVTLRSETVVASMKRTPGRVEKYKGTMVIELAERIELEKSA